MAVGKAAGIGAVAALAIPYVTRDDPGALGGWLARGIVHFTVGGVHLSWSWPIFCLITLFAWGFLAWSDR